MNYQESLDYIKSLVPTLEKPTMARMRLYFEELDNPQNRIACFHVGGTNGKGSVSTFLASMLHACGNKVGKFTGPHLTRYNERLVIDGLDIGDDDFAQIATVVLTNSRAFAERHPEHGHLTWFEFLTAMAVEYFIREKVDVAVFEVGLGGRFDATNALQNIIVSTITNVDLDHMQFLGKTVEAIATEKSGILKNAPLVTAAGGAALTVLEQAALTADVPLVILSAGDSGPSPGHHSYRNFSVTVKNASAKFSEMVQSRVLLLQKEPLVAGLKLSAAYQRLNALTALVSFSISDIFVQRLEQDKEKFFERICSGIENSYWPGRFEIIEERAQILDGAHNPHGARALRLSLDEKFGAKSFVFIFASFENKDARGYLKELVRTGDVVIAPHLEGERPFHKFEDIETICKELGLKAVAAANFDQAAQKAREIIAAGSGQYADMAVVTGSFATVREAMTLN